MTAPLQVLRSRTLLTLVVGGTLCLALAPGASPSGLESPEQSLVRAINDARAAYGAPPLRVDGALQRAARSHSNAILRTGNFTHGNWYWRLRRHGARGRTLGETIAWVIGADGTAAAIVRMWLASPPHRQTLLRRGFRRVGVGVAVGGFAGFSDARVATADFAGS
ncbi:MAG: CAP domain-containing protein [Actinomycetota bacterium]|nr:CAP domain-containing protein [Actinomycetota bacterium]